MTQSKKFTKLQDKLIPRPLADRVIVTAPPEKEEGADPNQEQRVGGIIVPTNSATGRVLAPYYIATVLAAGPDCKVVKKGNTVVASRPDLFHVSAGDVDVYMIRETQITAVL